MHAQPGDVAQRALEELVVELLERCLDELVQARARAEKLLVERRSGRPWLDVVTGEHRPLVVERISTVPAALFGVSRQRISALLRDNGPGLEEPRR